MPLLSVTVSLLAFAHPLVMALRLAANSAAVFASASGVCPETDAAHTAASAIPMMSALKKAFPFILINLPLRAAD
jgi:hypothetical protein